MEPLISIITVNYNQAELTLQLLDSVNKLEYGNIELWVVDNGSSVPLPESEVKRRCPEAFFIRSGRNLGFAGGNNLALRKAKGDYLFLVNNDAELKPGTIDLLLQTFGQKPDAGVVCPKICHFDQPDVMQFIGFTKISAFTARNRTLGEGEKCAANYMGHFPTPYAHGAAMMLKREALLAAGEMPDEYFLYYEELAWSENIRRKGYGIYVNPRATVYHKGSASVGRDKPLKTYYLNRNRILFMRNYAHIGQLAAFAVYLLLISMPKNTLGLLLKGKTQHLGAYWAAMLWHLGRRKNEFEPGSPAAKPGVSNTVSNNQNNKEGRVASGISA